MPEFRKSLPTSRPNQGFDLKRTPERGALQGIITCENYIVCDTHFYRGRTQPCERVSNDGEKTIDDSNCAACRDKIGYRTHVYASVFDVKTREHFIFECTDHAAKPLDDYQKSNGTLRGCILYASRPKGTKNSKVFVETNTANLQKIVLPNPPDLQRALCVIWRIPLDTFEPVVDHKKNGRLKTNNSRMKDLRDQPDNACEPASIADILPNAMRKVF